MVQDTGFGQGEKTQWDNGLSILLIMYMCWSMVFHVVKVHGWKQEMCLMNVAKAGTP